MPYNNMIARTEADALIPEDAAREIIKSAPLESAVLSLFERKQMSRNQKRLPVLSLKPTAYWVNGDTGLKQTTEVNWTNKYLDAEELAVIVPVPEALLDDVDYDLWAEIKPELTEALAVALDDAVLFGTNKPTSWPNDIKTDAVNAGNTRNKSASDSDAVTDISATMKLVEADGFPVNGFIISNLYRADLRGAVDANKQPLFTSEIFGSLSPVARGESGPSTISTGRLFGLKAVVHELGLSGFAQSSGNVALFCGDFRQGIIGVRQDLTWKMLDQAVIQDNTGAIVYNLAQQDMVALRVVARYAFQVANPLTRMNTSSSTRYPFAVLRYA